jgi:hypothetical protein
MERVARQLLVGQMGDVVHRARDVVDRHDVRLATLRSRQRDPLGQGVPELLDQLEEVVGAVDLVHLAGLGVTDDDAGAEDQRLGLDAVAHELLRLVLRAVIVVRKLLVLVEHVLLEHAPVEARHGDRAGVVKAPDVVRVRELDHVARAVHVGPHRLRLVGLDVVDRRQVKEMVDPLLAVLDPETGLVDVADDGDDATLAGSQALRQRVDLAPGALADEDVDRAVALQQLLEQVAADEARGSRDEVVQDALLFSPRTRARVYISPGPTPAHTSAPPR